MPNIEKTPIPRSEVISEGTGQFGYPLQMILQRLPVIQRLAVFGMCVEGFCRFRLLQRAKIEFHFQEYDTTLASFLIMPLTAYISHTAGLPVLPPESDLPPGLGRRCHQLADGVEDDPELLVVFIFHLIDLPLKFLVRK
jgi:hypothetical protein